MWDMYKPVPCGKRISQGGDPQIGRVIIVIKEYKFSNFYVNVVVGRCCCRKLLIRIQARENPNVCLAFTGKVSITVTF